MPASDNEVEHIDSRKMSREVKDLGRGFCFSSTTIDMPLTRRASFRLLAMASRQRSMFDCL
eukprot:30179-Eustigmatos_ZCMA.PRE.1